MYIYVCIYDLFSSYPHPRETLVHFKKTSVNALV